MVDIKNLFTLTQPENLDNSNASKPFSFDDLSTLETERERVKRKTEIANSVILKVDYSDFSNHVFFDVAEEKLNIAKNKILNTYPYNGNTEEKDLYLFSGSKYEEYFSSIWPKSVGYLQLSGSKDDIYLSASDRDSKLYIGSSSFYVSAWIKTSTPSQTMDHGVILQYLSRSVSTNKTHGYELYLTGAKDLQLKFSLYSGSTSFSISSSYISGGISLTASDSWHNIAYMYDKPTSSSYLWIDSILATSSIGLTVFNDFQFNYTDFRVGSGSAAHTSKGPWQIFSGAIDEVRVLHTSSADLHSLIWNKKINAEEYVKLNYRFNEGIVGETSLDRNVVDYSKSELHGLIANYASKCRISGNSYTEDVGDHILYSTHSNVIAFTSSLYLSASSYDSQNRNCILRLVPSALLEVDDNEEHLLTYFLLSLARYFDEIKLYIDQFDKLKTSNYFNTNEAPDVLQPYLQKYLGWKITEKFSNENPLNFFFGQNLPSGSLSSTLEEIRNEFWQRTLNNLPYIYKSKGKRSSIEALFNVLGINKNIIRLKEYGSLTNNNIENEYIHLEKPISFLTFGKDTPSHSTGSYVKISSFLSAGKSEYTVESYVQLPSVSSSFGSGSLLTGSVWSFSTNPANPSADPNYLSFGLIWMRDGVSKLSGSLILTGSDGQKYRYDNIPIFNGDFVHIAAGLDKSAQYPFISYRIIDETLVSLSGTSKGTLPLSGVFVSGGYDFVIGAQSASFNCVGAQNYIAETRYWSKELSASELDNHALNIQSVAYNNPLEKPYPLLGQWTFDENVLTDATGTLLSLNDLSRNNKRGKGYLFNASVNPFTKFEININYISPSIDLKWTENKIRIKNKSRLDINDISNDTNFVSLEFNLIDALNEDIIKIFNSLDFLNNVIGNPVNKYRNEYADLEAYRRFYFQKISTHLNFTRFFKFFNWFDTKLGLAIKQLLPARVNFVGGECVVENHILERSRYDYKYPTFKTPKDLSTGSLNGYEEFLATKQEVVLPSTALKTIYTPHKYDGLPLISNTITTERETLGTEDAELSETQKLVSHFGEGEEIKSRDLSSNLYLPKYSGDQKDTVCNSANGINNRNEYIILKIRDLEANNKDTITDGAGTVIINSKLKRAGITKSNDGTKHSEHYFSPFKKHVKLQLKAISGSCDFPSSASFVDGVLTLTGSSVSTLLDSVYIAENVFLSGMPFYSASTDLVSDLTKYSYLDPDRSEYRYSSVFNITDPRKNNLVLSYEVSASNVVYDRTSIHLSYSIDDTNYYSINQYFKETLKNDGWRLYELNLNDFNKNTTDFSRLIFNTNKFKINLSTSGQDIYVFKNLKLEFDQPLTDEGVIYFNNLDNQNIENSASFVNQKIVRNVEKQIRDISFLYQTNLNKNNDYSKWIEVNDTDKNIAHTKFAIDTSRNRVYTIGFEQVGFANAATYYGYRSGSVRYADLNDLSAWTNVDNFNYITYASGNFAFIKVNPYTNDIYYSITSNGVSYLRKSTDGETFDTVLNDNKAYYVDLVFSESGGPILCVFSGSARDGTANIILKYSADGEYQTYSTYSDISTYAAGKYFYPTCMAINEKYIYVGGSYTQINGVFHTTEELWSLLRCGRSENLTNVYTYGLPGLLVNCSGNFITNIATSPISDEVCIGGYVSETTTEVFKGFQIKRSGSDTGGDFITILSESADVGEHIINAGIDYDYKGRIYTYINKGIISGSSSTTKIDNIKRTELYLTSAFRSITEMSGSGTAFATSSYIDNLCFDNTRKRLYFLYKQDFITQLNLSSSWYYSKTTYPHSYPISVMHNSPYTGYGALCKVDVIDNVDLFSEATVADNLVYLTSSNVRWSDNEKDNFISKNYSPTMLVVPKNISKKDLYATPNLILGTTDNGTIGNTDEDIVQVTYVGSIVKILWPKQSFADIISSNGFGSLAPGQKAGTLTTQFVAGEFFDVEKLNVNHLSLYCYAKKEEVGSEDGIVLRVERRPLRSAPFTVDQSIVYTPSGSYMDAQMKDLVYTKMVDYSDLSIKEVGYVIDVPLQNTKEIRISAKQLNGTISEKNAKLVVWGRFINSNKDTI